MKFLRLNKWLVFFLILPLMGIAILSFALAYPFTKEAFLINLATDAISIIVTVVYVDWILHRFEDEKWKEVKKHISNAVSLMAMGVIGDIADIAELYRQIYPDDGIALVKEGKLKEWLNSTRKAMEALPRRDIIQALKKLDSIGWNRILKSLELRRDESTAIISQFGARMRPEELECVLSFRRSVKAMFNSIDLLKYFLGVPIEKMPKVRGGKPEDYTAIETIRPLSSIRT